MKLNKYGKLCFLISFIVLAPVCIVPFYPKEFMYVPSFLLSSLVAIIFGILIGRKPDVYYKDNIKKSIQSASGVVLFAWAFGIFVGALPFVVTNYLNPVQAIFESVSGWTTTGLSVIDVSVAPHIFLFHRAFMQFCGGLGFIMMMIIFTHGKDSSTLYSAEGHPDKLYPNVRKSAQVICALYCGFLLIGIMLYQMCGMNLFDSIVHAMCSLSTGGFSTKVDSIGYYNSLSIEVVTIVLMLIGTTNFGALLLLIRGKFVRFIKVSEIRFMVLLLIVIVPLTGFVLTYGLYINLHQGMRLALFNIVSALSTTGYSTMPYDQWPQAAIAIMILMMIIGGGIGSTAGGLKLSRVYLLLRIIGNNLIQKTQSSRSIKKLTYIEAKGEKEIDKTLINETFLYFSCYIIIFFVGSILLSASANCDFVSAMFDFASSLGTVGLSMGITGPSTNMMTLCIEIIGMILGRLEIYVIFIGIYDILKKLKR